MKDEPIKCAVRNLGLQIDADGVPLISSQGGLQRWLIDLRVVFMQSDLLEQIALTFWERYADRERFQLAGMETAAIPLLTALLLLAPKERGKVNGFIIRKQRKTTGLGNAIEGIVTDDPIILVDDILNSGSSAEKARSIVRSIGKSLHGVFVVIDYRSARGRHWREQNDLVVDSLYTLADFDLELKSNPPPLTTRYNETWRISVPGGFPFYVVPKSTPLLADNRLYRGCDAGKMHAFAAESGAIVWEHQATGTATRKGIWSSPAVDDNRLYYGAYNGCVYSLNAETGEELWAQSYGEWVGASPIVVPRHGLVYFGLENERPWAKGSIAALDVRDGRKVWERLTKAFQHGSPAYWKGGDLIIWGTADHDMLGLDASTGALKWTFKTRRSVKYAPAIEEERALVAFASFDKSIYVLDAKTGQKKGEWETGEICYTTPLFVGNKLFCGSGDRHLYVIDIDCMKVIKKLDFHARIYSSPVLVGNSVIFGTTGGRVIEVDIHTLDVCGQFQLPDAVTNAIAVSADGRRIYASTYMNHLYAFERHSAVSQVTEAHLGNVAEC